MAEDLVNQITLNCLISKNQLQKLNKKLNENTENNRKSNKDIYEDRIKTLFYDLLKDRKPDDLLEDVKTGFDFFLDKCIYYFKAVDNNEILEKEKNNTLYDCDIINDDIDFEKEEKDIERGNYKENEDEEDEEEEKINSTFVKPKYLNKSNISKGEENIQQLPLNWFQNIRQNYKKNKIIPRKKEIIIDENSFSFEKKKI